LKNQIYMGSDAFIESALATVKCPEELREIPKIQKYAPPKPLEYYQQIHPNRDAAMYAAYLSG